MKEGGFERASGDSKVVAHQFSLTFGGVEYDVKSIVPGVSETTDLPDVTVGKDVEQRFEKSAVTEDAEFTVTMASAPSLNAVGAVVVKMKTSEGGAAVADDDKQLGPCIVTNVTPATIEAGGDRVRWFDVTFRPTGARS